MKQQLEAKGWIMYYECVRRCGHKQFFNHPDYNKYEVVVKGNTFNIRLESHVIGGPFHAYQLDEKLKQYVK